MLFTKPIQEITFDDVVSFCQEGHPENSIIEYKIELPSNDKIAKTISALANTYGGIFIIGIDAPDGKPKAPFVGMKIDPVIKYEEKIESICLASIKEPVFPEVKMCISGEYGFVVIRVAESTNTPHRVAHNTRIYVRTGQSSTPNEEAEWDKIEWLVSRRKNSIVLREQLEEKAKKAFSESCFIKGIDIKNADMYFGILSLMSVPLFPNKALKSYDEFQAVGEEISAGRSRSFPQNFYSPKLVQDGVQKFEIIGERDNEENNGKKFIFTYLNRYGVYYHNLCAGELWTDGEIKLREIHYFKIISSVCYYIESIKKFYQCLGYWGTIGTSISLSGLLGTNIKHPLTGRIHLDSDDEYITLNNNDLDWKIEMSFQDMQNSDEIIKKLIHDISWSLGMRYLTPERVEKIFEEIKKS